MFKYILSIALVLFVVSATLVSSDTEAKSITDTEEVVPAVAVSYPVCGSAWATTAEGAIANGATETYRQTVNGVLYITVSQRCLDFSYCHPGLTCWPYERVASHVYAYAY